MFMVSIQGPLFKRKSHCNDYALVAHESVYVTFILTTETTEVV